MREGVKDVLMGGHITRVGLLLAASVAVCLGTGTTMGCVAGATTPPARVIIVTSLPPAPIVEERTPQTRPATVWIAGYWHWTGIQYAWIPGHWEVSPHVGATWRAPRYVKAEGSYIYEPGTWNGSLPAGATANAFR